MTNNPKTLAALFGHDTTYMYHDIKTVSRAQAQWQFGDWLSLKKMKLSVIKQHPQRADLALLGAAGNFQCGDFDVAHFWLELAQEWGCSRNRALRVLVAGGYNSLGRVALVKKKSELARRYIVKALSTGVNESDVRLLAKARLLEQTEQLKLSMSSDTLE